RAGGKRLAAARLAHDAHRLPRRDREVDAVHRAHDALGGEDVRPEAADLEDRAARHGRDAHVPYGSAASRRPSPRKLSASTATTTATPGQNSHGAVATERTFCASWSCTPQLTTGERRPMPRKLSEVSARIMAGIARVTEAMMWLV